MMLDTTALAKRAFGPMEIVSHKAGYDCQVLDVYEIDLTALEDLSLDEQVLQLRYVVRRLDTGDIIRGERHYLMEKKTWQQNYEK